MPVRVEMKEDGISFRSGHEHILEIRMYIQRSDQYMFITFKDITNDNVPCSVVEKDIQTRLQTCGAEEILPRSAATNVATRPTTHPFTHVSHFSLPTDVCFGIVMLKVQHVDHVDVDGLCFHPNHSIVSNASAVRMNVTLNDRQCKAWRRKTCARRASQKEVLLSMDLMSHGDASSCTANVVFVPGTTRGFRLGTIRCLSTRSSSVRVCIQPARTSADSRAVHASRDEDAHISIHRLLLSSRGNGVSSLACKGSVHMDMLHMCSYASGGLSSMESESTVVLHKMSIDAIDGKVDIDSRLRLAETCSVSLGYMRDGSACVTHAPEMDSKCAVDMLFAPTASQGSLATHLWKHARTAAPRNPGGDQEQEQEQEQEHDCVRS